MIARFLPTLAAKIAGGAVVALLLALLAMRIAHGIETRGLNRQIERLTTENRNLARDLGTCRGNVATLQGSISAQNAALERVRADGATRVAELERSLSTARISAQTAQSRAAAILARRPGADQCADALAIIRGE